MTRNPIISIVAWSFFVSFCSLHTANSVDILNDGANCKPPKHVSRTLSEVHLPFPWALWRTRRQQSHRTDDLVPYFAVRPRGGASHNHDTMQKIPTDIPLSYPIFTSGRSALRDLPITNGTLPPATTTPVWWKGLWWHNDSQSSSEEPSLKTSRSLQILRHVLQQSDLTPVVVGKESEIEASSPKDKTFHRSPGDEQNTTHVFSLYLDAAHEILLGVTPWNLDDAEYAGSHRGQTSWNEDHPLDDEMDHWVHAIIHRWEGSCPGEGGYAGYENADYWALGGPRKHAILQTKDHPVYQALLHYAQNLHSEVCDNFELIVPSTATNVTHTIIAGGSQYRTITVLPDSWDWIAVNKAWKSLSDSFQTQEKMKEASMYTSHPEKWRRCWKSLEDLFRMELTLLLVFETSHRSLTAEELLTKSFTEYLDKE